MEDRRAAGAKAQHRTEIGHKSGCIVMDTALSTIPAPGNLQPREGGHLFPGALQGEKCSFHIQSLQGIPGHSGAWSSKWLLSGKRTTMLMSSVKKGRIKPWNIAPQLDFPSAAGIASPCRIAGSYFYLLGALSLGL